ncbi:ATP-binding protein [Labilibaculum manganireducens]|uniref:ATP-binding protein n=1 Tax=Labilibaculum manganireducens TaxID=1940525 RepID=UPI0029F4D156|nr:ATP-binding protein [Labilibaculum manganireducens]
MKFYNREKEIAQLHKIEKKSRNTAQMTFMLGRRRIGKTSLLIRATENYKTLYFFVSKKSEPLLCEEFTTEIKNKLGVDIFGEFKSFKDVFGYLLDLSTKQHFTLIIDEFQEFNSINSSIYSEMQNIWDSNKNESSINLLLCGSVYSLMSKIFENSKEPLFGRATARIHLKAFDIAALKEILSDHYPEYTKEDLLAFYLVTGGVAKYVEMLVEEGSFIKNDILDHVFSDNSLFIDEGKNVLIDEFGKDYGNYFSILSLIASSKTSRVEMESVLEINIGGFLNRLESDYGLIKKVKPIFSKPNSRSIKYQIKDNFLNFWFRFIYKYRSAVEIGNIDYIKNIVERDYDVYSGRILEKYFVDKMIQEGIYSDIGTYWEKGNKNEIDIVAVNEYEKRLVLAEVKRNKDKIKLNILQQKASSLLNDFNKYSIEYIPLSLDEM